MWDGARRPTSAAAIAGNDEVTFPLLQSKLTAVHLHLADGTPVTDGRCSSSASMIWTCGWRWLATNIMDALHRMLALGKRRRLLSRWCRDSRRGADTKRDVAEAPGGAGTWRSHAGDDGCAATCVLGRGCCASSGPHVEDWTASTGHGCHVRCMCGRLSGSRNCIRLLQDKWKPSSAGANDSAAQSAGKREWLTQNVGPLSFA